MPFDLKTATAVEDAPAAAPAKNGFDLNSAQPVENDVLHLADKNMTIDVPQGTPEHQVVNSVRDHIYGNDPVPSVPEEGRKPFTQAMTDHLQLGYANGIAGLASVLGVDKKDFMKQFLLNDQEKAVLSGGTEGEKNPYKQFGYRFSESVGGLVSTLPLYAATGEAAVAGLMGRVPAAVMGVLKTIPNFAIGAGLFGAGAGAKKYAPAGPVVATVGAVEGAAENLFWNTLYGKAGTGLAMFPKMIGINVANTTYEAAKQNRIPTSKELYLSAADGIAYGALFSLIPHFSSKSDNPAEKKALDTAHAEVNKAVLEGDHEKPQQILTDLVNNEAVRPELRDGMTKIFKQTQTAVSQHAQELTQIPLAKEEGETTSPSGDISHEISPKQNNPEKSFTRTKSVIKSLYEQNKSVLEMPEATTSEKQQLLQSMSRSAYEAMAQDPSFNGRTATENDLSELFKGLSKTGEIDEAALRSLFLYGQPNAPQGLHEAAGSDLAVPSSPLEIAQRAQAIQHLTEANVGRELTPHERLAQDFVANRFPEAKQNYTDQAVKEFNADNIISSDIGKFSIPGMMSERSADYHESGSALARVMEYEKLANQKTADLPVGFLAGGSGAGKSHSLRNMGKNLQEDFALTHDTNLNNFKSAKEKIDRALATGRKVAINYVYRDPIESYKNGVIPRVRTQDRIVPIKDHVETHLGVRPTIEKILKHYAGKNIELTSILNTGVKDAIKKVPLEKVPEISYTKTELKEELYKILKDAYENGKITDGEFETALTGSADLQKRAEKENVVRGYDDRRSAQSAELRAEQFSRLDNESGHLDVATLPGVEQAAQNITNAKEFLRRSQQFTPVSKNIAFDLSRLQTEAKADEIRAGQLLNSYELKPEDEAAIYRYADNIDVHGDPQGAELTPEQQKVYDEIIAPIQKAKSKIFSNLRNSGIPVTKELQLPRQVVGRGTTFDRLKEGLKRVGGSILRKTAPEFKERTMKALVDENGNRVVASIKKGEVVAWRDGKAEGLGKINAKEYEDLMLKEMSPLENQARRLEREQDILSATKGRYLASESRIDGIHLQLSKIYDQIGDIRDKFSPHNLNDKVFVDKNGGRWTVKDATVDEIEKNTNLKYYKNAALNTIDSYLRLRKVERATQFLEQFKTSPDFKNIAVKFEGGSIPENWKPVNMPQFRGYAFEPRIADTLDDFYTKVRTAEDPAAIISSVNRFLRSSIFFNPLIHIPNISVHWAVNRGFTKWLMPKEYKTLMDSSMKAIEAVFHQNEDYVKMLDEGANLLYHDVSGEKIHDIMLKKMGEELNTNSPLRDNVAKALGYVNPANLVKAIYDFSSKATWSVNDLATMQAVYEEMAHGRTIGEAVREVGKHIPDYRVPARIFDSKALADIMKNPNLTMFGAYHYGALKSYGEMVKSLVDVNKDPKGAAETLDKLLMLGLIGLVIYPLLDNVAKQLTGNKDASFRRAGATTFPFNTYQFIKGRIDFSTYLFGIATPAPLLKTGVEVGLNRDLFTGKNIYSKTDAGEATQDLGQYALKQVAPVGQAERLKEGKQTAKEAALGLVGIKSPHQLAHTDAEQTALNIMHSKNFGSTEMTDEEKKAHLLKQNLAMGYEKTKDDSEMRQAVKNGDITAGEMRALKKSINLPPIVRMTKQMTVKEVQKVMKNASPEEKKLLTPILKRKIRNKLPKSTDEERAKFQKLLKDLKEQ